jgi:hypothetical protein
LDKADKVVIFFLVAVFAVGTVILVTSMNSAPSAFVPNGNFTVQSKTPVQNPDGSLYTLVWHGGNGTVQLSNEFTHFFLEVNVFEGKDVSFTVTDQMSVYENYTKLFTLYP